MSSKPKIIFDTTAINRLEDSGTDSEPLMRGLESGYLLCLTAKRRQIISITKNPQRREPERDTLGFQMPPKEAHGICGQGFEVR